VVATLTKAGADVSVQSPNGFSPLHTAACSGYVEAYSLEYQRSAASPLLAFAPAAAL
jgi:hypothetical protein